MFVYLSMEKEITYTVVVKNQVIDSGLTYAEAEQLIEDFACSDSGIIQEN